MYAHAAHTHRAVLPPAIARMGLLVLALALLLAPAAGASKASAAAVGESAPTVPPAQHEIDAWLERAGVDTERAAAIRSELASLPQMEQCDLADLNLRLRALAPADSRIEELLSQIDRGAPPPAPPAWLGDEGLPVSLRANLAVRAGAEHFVRRRYEECLAWLTPVSDHHGAARELALYYRTVAHHQLAQMEAAAAAADALLAIESPRLRRSHNIARLVERDADAHRAGSLTHVAQQMNDVQRRLGLGRSGEAELELQQEVIDAIDKLIEDAEERRRQQQQQQQQQLAEGGRSMTPKPLEESRATEMKGAGEVDQRDLTPGGDWGSLPPAERERVTQGIIRDFPTHYREVIQDYFRSLAEENRPDEDRP